MSFGWSAGDIVSACILVKDIVDSLDATRGSASQYQQTKLFLDNLNGTLNILKMMTDSHFQGECEENIRRLIESMNKPINDLLAMIKNYSSALGRDTTMSESRSFPRKLKWQLFDSKEIAKLQDAIERQISNLNTGLEVLILKALKLLPAQIQTIVTTTFDEKMKDVAQKPDVQAINVGIANINQHGGTLVRYFKEYMTTTEASTQNLEEVSRNILARTHLILETLERQRETTLPQREALEPVLSRRSGFPPTHLIPSIHDKQTEISLCLAAITQSKYLSVSTKFESLDDTWRPDVRLHRKLNTWWTYDLTSFLWIKEPAYRRLSKNAIAVITAANRSRVPTMHCRFQARSDDQNVESGDLQSMVEVLYSAIYQLGMALLKAKSSEWNLSPARFEQLNGTPESIPTALALVRDLIGIIRGRQIIILSGFETFDDKDNATLREHISALLEILRPSNEIIELNIIKTLVFTTGPGPTILEESLGNNEKLNLSTPTKQCSFYPLIFPHQTSEISSRAEDLY